MSSKMLTTTKLALVLLSLCLQGLVWGEAASSLTTECSPAVQQVTSCLGFATGKGAEPTKECCTAVSSMKEKQPVCLCFFIGQAHNGSEQIKSLGIQESKLMQLPSACHLTNASVAECPKLLGISPASPAASIFMHNNMSTSPTTAAPLSSSSSSTTTPGGVNSNGFKHDYGVVIGGFVAVFVSALVCAPITGNSKFLL